jgi:two-component system sensor histidine kinase BaeS
VKKTFLVFLLAFLVQISLMVVLISFGYQQSESQWQTVRSVQARQAALAVLTGDSSLSDSLDFPGQLAVYDANRILIATNRGMGARAGVARNLTTLTPIPLLVNGKVIGYYATVESEFGQDSANKALLDTMVLVLLAGIFLSLAISLLAALYFARLVSRPADHMSNALQRMTDGDLSKAVEGSGSEEIVKIARAIESLRNRLLSERTLRTQWAQDLAHDLRTPVSSIKAQLEGMADGILPATPDRFLKNGRELLRMESLINDLEELMRLESPETRILPEPIDAHWFTQSARERFEALILQKPVHFYTNVTIDSFNADEGLLSRAISNILSNAIRHCDAGGAVTLEITGDGKETRLAVHNTGSYIAAAEIPKIFERLYRGEFARNSPGSGLGLTIVERIVHLHGGTIAVESEQGLGTTFTCVLPAV